MKNRIPGRPMGKNVRMLFGVSYEKFSCEMVNVVAEINLQTTQEMIDAGIKSLW
ncbi:TPA: hypothetical protein ACXZUL_003373 [Salmonella enterica]